MQAIEYSRVDNKSIGQHGYGVIADIDTEMILPLWKALRECVGAINGQGAVLVDTCIR
jgi:hypothetical protein